MDRECDPSTIARNSERSVSIRERIETGARIGVASISYSASGVVRTEECDPENQQVSEDMYDWEFVQRDVKNEVSGRREVLPACEFPGTYQAAYNDSAKVGKAVAVASMEFVKTVAQSGIGKAGWSVGAALANTANRYAVVAANAAVDKAGVKETKFPTGVRKWLEGKEKLDEAKRRAAEAEQARLQRKSNAELAATREVNGAFVRPQLNSQPRPMPKSRAEPPPESPPMVDNLQFKLFRVQNIVREYIGTPPGRSMATASPYSDSLIPYTNGMSPDTNKLTPPGSPDSPDSGVMGAFDSLETTAPVRYQLSQTPEVPATPHRTIDPSDLVDVSLQSLNFTPYHLFQHDDGVDMKDGFDNEVKDEDKDEGEDEGNDEASDADSAYYDSAYKESARDTVVKAGKHDPELDSENSSGDDMERVIDNSTDKADANTNANANVEHSAAEDTIISVDRDADHAGKTNDDDGKPESTQQLACS